MDVRRKQIGNGSLMIFVLLVCTLLLMSSMVLAGDTGRSSGGDAVGDGSEYDELDCRNSNDCSEIDLVWSILLTNTNFDSVDSTDLFWNPYDGEEIIGEWMTYLEKYPEYVEVEEEEEVECENELSCDSLTTISGNEDYLRAGSGHCGEKDMVDALNEASEAFKGESGERLYVVSSFRTVEKQAELYWDHCYGAESEIYLGSCSPPTGSLGISSSKLEEATSLSDVKNLFCSEGTKSKGRHTSATAVDVWHENTKGSFVSNVEKVNQMQDAMQAEGFCRLSSEAWHFDYGSCTKQDDYTYSRSGKEYNPADECEKNNCPTSSCWWDYNGQEYNSCDEYESSDLAGYIFAQSYIELDQWDVVEECDEGVGDTLISSYYGVCDSSISNWDCIQGAWSGGFITYILREAGLNIDGQFPDPSCEHNDYFTEIRDDLEDESKDYSCFTFRKDQVEQQVEMGDIACYCESGVDCDGDYDSDKPVDHCEILTDVGSVSSSSVITVRDNKVVEAEVDLSGDNYVGFIRCG